MLCKEVTNYINSPDGYMFFCAVGDEDYNSVLNELKQYNLSVLNLSNFCANDDKFPSIDKLIDHLCASDADCRPNKCVVVGLGEYLAFRGSAYASKELARLKCATIGNAAAVLLLRGVSAQAEKLIAADPKMRACQRTFIAQNTATDITVSNYPENAGLAAQKGFKGLLRQLEEGAAGNLSASSALSFEDSLFPVKIISNPYDIIKLLDKNFNLPEELGTSELWHPLLKDIQECDNRISDVYAKYCIDKGIIDDLNRHISGSGYENWLKFLYLKQNEDSLSNSYLQIAARETSDYKQLKNKLIVKLTEFSHKMPGFRKLHAERKKLLKNFSNADIAIFIKTNDADCDESIYRYTDNTLAEKQAIVKWIAAHGIPGEDALSYVYPALNAYLKKYIFECPALASELTEYFNEYKLLKTTNKVTDSFMKLVEKYASNTAYARLPTRENAIKSIPDKNNAFLYWIDALGVEYLSYISELAKDKGLSVRIDIVRCDLPTITAVNKSFYDEWKGKKCKDERLDEIKHKDKGSYFFTKDEAPIHIPKELEIIEKAVDRAASELNYNCCKSFIIASDHGSSRLAVIKKQDIPYETDTKGEHSGRCCKFFDRCDVPYKIEENGFIVLSDYGRFKGSRSANVEAHGGASLEEVVIPLITLTLKKAKNAIIRLIDPDNIIPDRRTGVILTIYISDVDFPDGVHLAVDGIKYAAKTAGDNRYEFNITHIKRSNKKPYKGDVFDGEDSIGEISFSAKGTIAETDDDFDNLF